MSGGDAHGVDKNGPRTHAGSGKQFGTETVRTRMILTVTPNPSLDRTYEVPSLERGEVIRATGDRMDPGGKGVNVSRAVAAAGAATLAVLPLGGAPGALVAQLLDEQGIEVAPVPVAGQTRSNIAVAEPDGTLTKINATGPELTRAEAESLLSAVRERSSGADWIACCGSLPRGLAPSWYADLVARAHAMRRPDRPRHLGPGPARRPRRTPRGRQAERGGARRSGGPPPGDGRRRGQGGRRAAAAGRAGRARQPRRGRPAPGGRHGHVLRQRTGRRRTQQRRRR